MSSLAQTICLLLFPVVVFSQTLNIYKSDGGVSNFLLSEIDSITFTPTQQFTCGTSQVTYEGKNYSTVQIGTHCWLKENLDVGTMIQGTAVQTNNSVIEKYCYNNDTNNCNTYGGLYQWDEAMQYTTTPGVKGICPTGWHLPTLTEFEELRAAVSNDGNALKAVGQGYGGGEGTNTSGFSALLAGALHLGGQFGSLGIDANFWSSTESTIENALFMNLYSNGSIIYLENTSLKLYGFSVRCVKD